MKYILTALVFCYFFVALPCHAQLSGEVDLGGGSTKSEAATEANIKEITVNGMGETLEAAEKQALAAAIRQAVGAYMDAKTIVENDEVIQDRILSVSNAFVEKYERVGELKKLPEGLIEITILAKVKTNQVVQALKENNLISGEVAGQNLWAEASTKVMNAQDAVAMLQAKFPELIKSCLTITPLDKDLNPAMTKDASGNLVPNTEPAIVEKNAETGEALLAWILDIGVEENYYKETAFPLLDKCFQAITESAASHDKMQFEPSYNCNYDRLDIFSTTDSHPTLNYKDYLEHLSEREFNLKNRKNNWPESSFVLIKSFSRNFDMCDFFYYPNSKNTIDFTHVSDAIISLELLDQNNERIAYAEAPSWTIFNRSGTTGSPDFIIGHKKISSRDMQPLSITILEIKLPISDLKDIRNVKINLIVNEPQISLRSTKN